MKKSISISRYFFAISLLLLPVAVRSQSGPVPQWIWGETDEEGGAQFKHTFELPVKPSSAVLQITADDFFVLTVNNRFLLFSENWRSPRKIDVSGKLKAGKNTISIRARNRDGAAGLLAWLETSEGASGESHRLLVTDASWKTRPGEKSKGEWSEAKVLGPLGMDPWGDPWSEDLTGTISVAEGFKVDKLYDVPAEQGSWVSLCSDGRGGFYASDQNEAGLFHFRIEEDQVVDVSGLGLDLPGAHGLAMVGDDLFAHIAGKGLYRLHDSDGDGIVDTSEGVSESGGSGEHGIHGLVREPGSNTLIAIGGNSSRLPQVGHSRITATYENDLIERFHSPTHLKRRVWVAPAGWIARFNPEANTWESLSVGYRNAYDVAVNAFGDLFTYDSDDESYLGMPWYRPTRILLGVSGSDYGWRAGSDQWPDYYEDSLPPLVEIGPGSPTGMLSGAGAKFPARYQNAIYALDWTYGTVRALHLTPAGSTYEVEVEEFLSGAPLPLTDAIIADDGSMIFTTGGRRIASAVYRVRYVGEESVDPESVTPNSEVTKAHQLRRQLESYHGHSDPAAVKEAWLHLASEDRFIRHAARIAIESQPVAEWRDRLAAESRPQAIVAGVVALARVGGADHATLAGEKLSELDLSALEESVLLGALRAQALTWERLGVIEPGSNTNRLLDLFPHENEKVTRELARLLAARKDPRMIEPALSVLGEAARSGTPTWADTDLISRNESDTYGGTFERFLLNRPPGTAIQVAAFLAELADKWSEDQALRYFAFLARLSDYSGGASYGAFALEFRDRAVERGGESIAAIADDFPGIGQDRRPIQISPPQGPGRAWTVNEALAAITEAGLAKANRSSGRNLFHATSCVACHRYDGEGGAIGPDLSNARGKFGPREMLVAILEPSRAISDQYGSHEVVLSEGEIVTGLVVEGESDERVKVFVGEELRSFPRNDVKEIRQSAVSMMPPGLVNVLNAEELRDLVAYLLNP